MADEDTTTTTSETDPADEGGTSSEGGSYGGEDYTAAVEKWKAHSRKHENAAKSAIKRAADLEKERDELRDSKSATEAQIGEMNQDVAKARLESRLARAGMDEESVKGLLGVIDPNRLMADGKPSDEAINAFAESFGKYLKAGSTPPPDPDAGRRDSGGEDKPDMNRLLRRAANR